MQQVLIVEDSRATARMLARTIEDIVGIPSVIASSKADAADILKDSKEGFLVALCDLNLPDAPGGEAVDVVLAHGIPCVVVSASINEKTRTRVLSLPITDYVVKRGPEDMMYLARLVRRIQQNVGVGALVVDDSVTYRKQIVQMLERQRLTVYQAENGQEALDMLAAHADIRLAVVDYNMPVMDGLETVSAVRKKYSMEELALIAATDSRESLAPTFLKSGANDFVPKSTSFEELVCRINMNLDMLDLIKQTKEFADKDGLTGLWNRRKLFEKGEELFHIAKREGTPFAVAMLDIDHFKALNEEYGHLAGDMVLRQVAEKIQAAFPSPALVTRYGGEEFCVVVFGKEHVEAFPQALDSVRQLIGENKLTSSTYSVSVTISIGCMQFDGSVSFEGLLNKADALLCTAKKNGRNCTVCE